MADMDSALKRASALRWLQPYSPAFPPVDGSISAGDRATWMWQYGGITFAAPAVTGPPFYLRGSTQASIYLGGSTQATVYGRGSTQATLTIRGAV